MSPRNWSWGKKRKSGYRSGFEEKIAEWLNGKQIKFEYESLVLSYPKTVRRGTCLACGSGKVVSARTYKPDFVLTDSQVVIEAKGRLTSPDRTKLVAVKAANPKVRLVLLLASDNRIRKGSDERYSNWCEKNHFDFAIGTIPRRWLSRQQPED